MLVNGEFRLDSAERRSSSLKTVLDSIEGRDAKVEFLKRRRIWKHGWH
jgi:hypothetical protein